MVCVGSIGVAYVIVITCYAARRAKQRKTDAAWRKWVTLS